MDGAWTQVEFLYGTVLCPLLSSVYLAILCRFEHANGVEATFVLSYSKSILLSIKDDMGLAVGRNDKCYDVFVFPYIRESDGVTGTFPYFEF